MASNYLILIQKLDEFIRKYYKNQLIRGVLYAISSLLLFFLAVTLLEYFAHFGVTTRTILFYLFILLNIGILINLIVIPLLKLNRFGNIISHQQAAEIIGSHFSNVQDKLLNVLQLQQQSNYNANLVQASINQRIAELKPIPFTSAIDLKENSKYVKYAFIPVFILLCLLTFFPNLITDPSNRLFNHTVYYEKEPPFRFEVLNKSMQAIQQQDFELNIKVSGNEIPANAYIEVGENEYSLNKENAVKFRYVFKNIQKTLRFRLFADGYYSKEYEITALPNPLMLGFQVQLDYPNYVGKKDEVLSNTGDMVIPAGTKVRWTFNTQHSRILRMGFVDTIITLDHPNNNVFSYSSQLFNNKTYNITTANEFLKSGDSISYSINVIPDMYPSIQVEERPDSISSQRIYFKGQIKDDYGFSKLAFNYKFLTENDSNKSVSGRLVSQQLGLNKQITQDNFFHYWDLTSFNIQPGDEIEYYFEVFDNDGVNGNKSARTQRMVYKAPTLSELAKNSEKNNKELKKDIQESIQKAKDLQKELADINQKMLEKKILSYDELKKIKDLLEKQKQLQKDVENIEKQNSLNNKKENEFKQPDEKLLEKQQQLEKLFEQIMTDEMKEKFKELEKLLSKMDKEKIQEQLEKMKLDNKDMEKELDRSLEIFKQLEFEKKMGETTEKLDKLAEDQKKLAEKTEEKKSDSKELNKEQEKLNKEFDEVKKELEDLKKKNAELEQPNEMKNTEELQQEISKEQEKSSEQLNENKNNSESKKQQAAKSQKKAGEKMDQLSQEMKSMQQQMEQQEQEEDMNALREILENLINVSFAQEELMKQTNNIDRVNPKYVEIARQQKKIKDDSKMIEDSLFALSKRQPQISAVVNREISEINANMEKAIADIADRQTQVAAGRQQYVMTGVNNLALMLSEALNQMQQQMQKKPAKEGSGSCKKPGGKGQKPSASTMKSMQQQINEQIAKLKEGMKNPNGKKDGKEGKDGKDGKNGKNSTSEQFARLAAQQEALRRELQKMGDEMNKDGKQGNGNMQKLAEQMEKTETDLVNKTITQETMMRQEEILTRLLESEKAERERDQDEKRESKESNIENFSNLNLFNEYNRLKMKETELFKTVPPSLNSFYKNKVTDYFNNVTK